MIQAIKAPLISLSLAAVGGVVWGATKLPLDPQQIGEIKTKGGSYFLFTGKNWGYPKDCQPLENRAVFESNRGAKTLGCVSFDNGQDSAYVRIRMHGQGRVIVFDIGDVEW